MGVGSWTVSIHLMRLPDDGEDDETDDTSEADEASIGKILPIDSAITSQAEWAPGDEDAIGFRRNRNRPGAPD